MQPGAVRAAGAGELDRPNTAIGKTERPHTMLKQPGHVEKRILSRSVRQLTKHLPACRTSPDLLCCAKGSLEVVTFEVRGAGR